LYVCNELEVLTLEGLSRPGHNLQNLAVPDNTFTMLTNTKQNLQIPNNTYQYQTTPNKPASVGITWY
jgi:hypothetical protein